MMNNINKNIISSGIKTIILTMIVFALFSPFAHAQDESRDLTEFITISGNGRWANSIADDNYASYWYTDRAANRYLQLESEYPVKHLYVCYAFKPETVLIQTSTDGKEWVDFTEEKPNEYYHVTYTFDEPTTFIRLKGSEESLEKFGVVEVKVFSEGTLPDYIQSWEPTHEKADMMIFSAHPDDEAVFFAGLIPYYAGEMDKKVITVYMTASDPCRRSEALNYQWTMHQTNLPMFAYFEDVFEENTSNYTKSIWKEDKTIDYMVSVIRQKKPEIIVSHDLNGEYGHGNHIFTAECLQKAVVYANDPGYHRESYEQYGTHEIKKLYLHLYHENQIHLDILDEPLEEYDGLTAIEVAQIGIKQYASQIKYQVVRVHDDESKFSCYNYGLAYTTVGYDTAGDDMFESIEPEPTPTIEPTAEPTPTIEPTASVTPTIVPSPSSKQTSIQNNVTISKTSLIVICTVAAIIFLLCIYLIFLLLRRK